MIESDDNETANTIKIPNNRKRMCDGMTRVKSCMLGLFALFVIAGLASCSKKELPYNERPVEQLYNEAMDKMQSGDFRNGAQLFDEVERQHPYSVWARRAMLMSAYC